MTLVPLDAIVVDRILIAESDISELVADIKKNGLRRPILVRQNMTLIDGLRRLQAAQKLKWQQIEAVVSDNINEIKGILADAHDEAPPPRRLYEFHRSLQQLYKERRDYLRNNGMWRLDERENVEEIPSYRDFCAEALKIGYRSYLGRVTRLYDLAVSGDPKVIELVRQVDAGTLSFGSAFHSISGRAELKGDITSKAEQRLVLHKSTRNLGILVQTLDKLASPLKVPTEEVEIFLKEIRAKQGQLLRVLTKIKKEIERSK